jgi:PAS domain S-box-containing protein
MTPDGVIATSLSPVTMASCQALLDALPGAVVLADGAGTILLVNAATERLFGYARAEVLGQGLELLLPAWEQVERAPRRAPEAATAVPWQAGSGWEVTGRRKDGSAIPVAVHRGAASPAGDLVAWFIRDIGPVARARERQRYLADASARLTSALDYPARVAELARLAVPTLADFCLVATAGEAGAPGPRAAAHADPARAGLVAALGDAPLDPADPGDLVARVLATGQRAYLPDLPAGWPASQVRDLGRRRRLRALAPRALLGLPLAARGHVLGVLLLGLAGSGRSFGDDDLELADELARRAALSLDNARLRAAAEQLAAERVAILKHINDGVITTDGAGRLTFVNAAARRLLGWSERAALDGARLDDVTLLTLAGQPYAREQSPLFRAGQRGETVVDLPCRIRRADGSDVIAQGSAAPVLAEDGRRLGAVLTLHDVTARHELERQKDEFFANVSHELRTPLAGIKASIELVLASAPPDLPAPFQRLLVIIDQAASRLARLVDDLLELTRLQAGRVQLQRRPSDLGELVQRSARAIEPLAKTRGQQVSVELPPEPVVALVDRERLEQVVLNLLSNAHKYGRAGGRIQVRLSRQAAGVVISVADDGPGIPAADQPHIFERFYRSALEATRRQQGSGLGLAIARAMVELHGGRIWVESTPGAGATFFIALPEPPADVAAPRGPGYEDLDRR